MNNKREIIFIVGPPKCGKSFYAEKMMTTYDGIKCYVGTLPKTIIYKDCIIEHQKRRPKDWLLLELTGDLKNDLGLFNKINPSPDLFLLDGLTFYFLRVFNNTPRAQMPSNILKLVQHTLKLFLDIQASFIIVDNIRLKSHDKFIDSVIAEIADSIQKEINKNADKYIRFMKIGDE